MEEIIIDCTQIRSREDLHRVFRESLSFPEYYGNNLDALHDCLMSISGKVRLENWETAETNLGDYGRKAKRVIASAALENNKLDLYI